MPMRALAISFIAAVTVVGCGKEGVPDEDTTSAKKAKSKASASDSDSDSDKSKGDDSADDSASAKDDTKPKKKSKKSNDDGLTVVRKAKDYITAPDVVFMYSFNESDAKSKAEKVCADRSKGDQEKQGACMAAAQKKFGADGYHFMQDDAGKWWWETVKIKNGTVIYVHRVPIEFDKESDKSIEVKVTGKDEAKGAKGYVPNQVTFEVPNAYQIVQSDPDEGKIVFEAKLGLMGDPGTKKKR